MDFSSTLVIPHVGRGGGAGIYIKDLIEGLSKFTSITVDGDFSKDYTASAGWVLSKLRMFFPHYKGVKLRAIFFWGARLVPEFFLALCLSRKYKSFFDSFDVIYLTSSIQVPWIVFIRIIGCKTRIVCVIQENLDFSNIGVTHLVVLKKWAEVVSITDSWADYAKEYGLSSRVLKNKFSMTSVGELSDAVCDFDAIYVGGGSAIKGVDLVLKLFEKLALEESLKLLLLGSYPKGFIERVDLLNKEAKPTGSRVELVGEVVSIEAYLARSKILLLPITAPHFCRPAVEAGLMQKTFIISGFQEILEFSEDNYNCLIFKPNDVDAFISKFVYLLRDHEERRRLEKNNLEFMKGKYSAKSFDSTCESIHIGNNQVDAFTSKT